MDNSPPRPQFWGSHKNLLRLPQNWGQGGDHKTPWLLALCILSALSSASLLTLHTPAQAATSSAVTPSMPPAPQEGLDAGDRAELLEHWSNPSYSAEERYQVAGLAVLLTGIAALAYRRRLALRRAYRDV